MRETRVTKLEHRIKSKRFFSLSWRQANKGVAVKECSHLLHLLQKLNREPIYSEFIIGGKHILVNPLDRDIVERIEGGLLYLVGLQEPLQETVGIKWGTNETE